MNFPCSICGQCCRHISHIPELRDFDSGNGVCKYLAMDNQCSIYHSRPEICQIDLMYKNHYANQIPEIEFIRLNAEACNLMQQQANLPESFRVKLTALFSQKVD